MIPLRKFAGDHIDRAKQTALGGLEIYDQFLLVGGESRMTAAAAFTQLADFFGGSGNQHRFGLRMRCTHVDTLRADPVKISGATVYKAVTAAAGIRKVMDFVG